MRRQITTLICLCMMLYASSVTIGNLDYRVFDYDRWGIGLAEVSCVSTVVSGKVEIPGGVSSSGGQFTVVRVADGSFENCSNITSITLPPTIQSIGAKAFAGCSSLTQVKFGNDYYDSISFGNEAFANCRSLKSIALPERTESLGASVFKGCSVLSELRVPSTLKSIGSNCFSGCNIEAVYAPSLKKWCEIKFSDLGSSPFSNSSSQLIVDGWTIENLEIPESLTYVNSYAFAGYGRFKSVKLHEKFKSLGEYSFCNAKIDQIVSMSTVPPTMGAECFRGVDKMTPVYVPDVAVSKYKEAAGWKNFQLYEAIITETKDRFTVDGIIYSAISETECMVIGSVKSELMIPESVEFGNVRYNVVSIGKEAFVRADLTSVQFPSTLREIGPRAFYMSGLSSVTIPSSVRLIGKEAFSENYYLSSLMISEGVERIDDKAFLRCNRLTSISIPGSVKIIGIEAFRECSSLTSLTLSEGIERIMNGAFMSIGIKKLRVPDSVTNIGANAFLLNQSLTTVLIGSGITMIDEAAFWHNGNLQQVTVVSSKAPYTPKNPFNKTGITVYVNKEALNSFTADSYWKLQNVNMRKIEFDEMVYKLSRNSNYGFGYKVYDSDLLRKIEFSSSNSSVFVYTSSLDIGGSFNLPGDFIIGRNYGTAMLNAKGEYGLFGSVEVKVLPIADSIYFDPNCIKIKTGETDTIEFKTVPAEAILDACNWSTSDMDVIRIETIEDNVGKLKVTGLKGGKAVVTVMSGKHRASCEVEVLENPSSVVLSRQKAEIQVGNSLTLSAEVSPENADKNVVWSSSDEKIATVNADGIVEAKSIGTAIIRATAVNGIYGTCEIRVLPILVESVVLSSESLEAKVGDSVKLAATVLPVNATDKTVAWSSSDETVATVDSDGNVEAKSIGTAIIRATAVNGIYGTCEIRVLPILVESVALSSKSLEAKVGDSVKLAATVLPVNATDKTVAWSSSDETVAIVDSDGNVEAKSVGTAIIRATAVNGIYGTCEIRVLPILVESVVLSSESLEAKVGDSVKLAATVLPVNATDKTVAWSSSDETVATVDSDGNVEAKSIGTAIIRATSVNGIDGTCEIRVLPILVECILLSSESVEAKVGESVKLIATVIPDNATDNRVIWTSDDDSVASVDEYGTVTINSIGETIIVATASDGSGVKAICHVGGLSAIEDIYVDGSVWDVFDIMGTRLLKNATVDRIKTLPRGIYIIGNKNNIFKLKL